MIFERTAFNDGRRFDTSYAGDDIPVTQQACTACHRGPYGTMRNLTAVGIQFDLLDNAQDAN